MSFNQSLFDQINSSNMYAVQNWDMIAKEIVAQTNLVNNINKQFADTVANRLAMTSSTFTNLALTVVGFTMATFMLWKEVAPKQYEAVKSNLSKAGKTIVEKVKFAGRKIKISFVNK